MVALHFLLPLVLYEAKALYESTTLSPLKPILTPLLIGSNKVEVEVSEITCKRTRLNARLPEYPLRAVNLAFRQLALRRMRNLLSQANHFLKPLTYVVNKVLM